MTRNIKLILTVYYNEIFSKPCSLVSMLWLLICTDNGRPFIHKKLGEIHACKEYVLLKQNPSSPI